MYGNFPQNSLEAYGATSTALARGEELSVAKVSVIDAVELTSALP